VLQLAQNPKSGAVELVETPAPACPAGFVLVQTLASVVSAGTERHTVKLGSESLLRTALDRPDLVQRVMSKFRRDGLAATLRTIQDRTRQRRPLGYSSCGRVVEAGEGVEDLRPGDIVACAGAEFASHAELAAVPRLLAARVPGGVSAEEAAFTTLGAIALQGVRLARAEIGENVAVIGLGLVGQIALQLLVAAGCRVTGVDLDPERVELARNTGAAAAVTAEEIERPGLQHELSGGRGWDCVLVAADSASNRPVQLAASLAREKGRVVLVGLVRTDIPRQEFYEKELELTISRSTGPGRYDPAFEVGGLDYPYSYVRWTETRNMEAFTDLLARRRISVSHLITHRFPFSQAAQAYELLLGGEPHLGIVFEYPSGPVARKTEVQVRPRQVAPKVKTLAAGVIGTGSFARSVLLSAMLREGFLLRAVAASRPLAAREAAEKFRIETAMSSASELLARDGIETVFIATRHDSHAALASQALEAGKHVFVEKPLALTREELSELRRRHESSGRLLMTGFNRRFSPFATEAKRLLKQNGRPFTFHYRVNAGPIPAGHWLMQEEQGGRIIGEVCHFIDLMTFLAGSKIAEARAESANYAPAQAVEDAQLDLRFEDGSRGTITYVTSNRAPLIKERLEVWAPELVIELDDFQEAWFYHNGGDRTRHWRRQAKGHAEELAAWKSALLAGGPPPISFDELEQTSLIAIEAAETLRRSGRGRA